MFEREIKFIYDFNLNKVKKTGSFLTYEQLIAADLHPAIMQYISAEIDFLIFEDRHKMLRNSVFDYSGGKITHYFNLIGQEVKKSKRFSNEYISKLILHASSFTVNFLIRPKWSLLKFIFDEEEQKTSAEIKQILNYLYYYGYLKNILVSYLDKKKILTMKKDEFSELLDKIEKLGVDTYLDDVLNTALKSMAEFFNIGTTTKSKVPLPAIHIFLKEKKLTDHINSLNENFGVEEKLSQEINDIQKILLSVKIKHDEEIEELSEEDIEDTQQKLDDETLETIEEETNVEEYANEETGNAEDTENEKIVEVAEEEEFDNLKSENETQKEYNGGEEEIIEEPVIETSEESFSEEIEEETEIENSSEKELEIENSFEEEVQEETEEPVDVITETGSDSNNTENEIIQEDGPAEDELTEFENAEETHTLEEILEDKIEAEVEEENESIEEELLENELPEEELQSTAQTNEDIEDDEPSLFGKEEFNNEEEVEHDEDSETSEPVSQTDEISGTTLIDMSEILENKNMTKIIENIFDYDMEDFANTIDMISECPTKIEALALINEIFENNNIKSNSKEAETFKSIISEYFDKV